MRRYHETFRLWEYLLFAVVTLAVLCLCVCIGSVRVPLGDTLAFFAAKLTGGALPEGLVSSIMPIRLPRVLCVALTGAALSLAGAAMQGLLKNPLADGSTLGVSSGASLGAVCAIAFGVTLPGFPFAGTMVMAILFAFGSLLVILGLSYKLDRSLSTNTIILIGVIFSMFVSSIMSIVITFAADKVQKITFWTMGSLSGAGYTETLVLLAALAVFGGVLLSRIMPRVKEEFQKNYRSAAEEEKKAALAAQPTAPKKPGKPTSGVIVEGLDSCLVKFAKCCNPLPGDPIVGFITRGYGVSIHKQDCVNVINAPKENEGRWVHAEWASNVTSEKFKSTIDITSQPRDTLLADVTILLSNMHIPMHALVAKESKDHSVILIQVTVEVNGVDQLNYLLNSLRAIKGVEDVRRTIQ